MTAGSDVCFPGCDGRAQDELARDGTCRAYAHRRGPLEGPFPLSLYLANLHRSAEGTGESQGRTSFQVSSLRRQNRIPNTVTIVFLLELCFAIAVGDREGAGSGQLAVSSQNRFDSRVTEMSRDPRPLPSSRRSLELSLTVPVPRLVGLSDISNLARRGAEGKSMSTRKVFARLSSSTSSFGTVPARSAPSPPHLTRVFLPAAFFLCVQRFRILPALPLARQHE